MFTAKEQQYLKTADWKVLQAQLQSGTPQQRKKKLRAYLYARGYQDFKFFFKSFFLEYCGLPFSRMHEDFFQAEAHPEKRGRREAIAAPRSHAKTTLKMLAKAIHAIVYGYEPFILVIGYNQQQAGDKIYEIWSKLQDRKIEAVFGTLIPKKGKRGGRRGFITTSDIRVMPSSRNQEVRGIRHGANRPTLIILDDVENLEECQNPEVRAKTHDWFFKTVLKLGQIDDTTNIILIGTCLHVESLLSELLVNSCWQSRKYQAIERFSERTDLWDEWKARFNDLSNSNRLQDADDYYLAHETDMLAGTQVLWPEGDSYYKLMKQLVSEGQAAFYSEKQNEPYDPERQLFKMEQAKRFELEYEGHAPKAIRWLDGSGKVILWNDITKIIAFHDPALCEKPGGKGGSDYAAIVVVAKDSHGYLYVLDCYLEKATPSQQIEAALALHDKWQLNALYLETNHFQSLLKAQYDQAQSGREGNSLLRVSGVHQHANKIERISATLEPVISNGHLLFSKTLPPRLIEQLTLFPTSYDDGPDALQGAVVQLKKKNYNEIPKSWAENPPLMTTGNEYGDYGAFNEEDAARQLKQVIDKYNPHHEQMTRYPEPGSIPNTSFQDFPQVWS